MSKESSGSKSDLSRFPRKWDGGAVSVEEVIAKMAGAVERGSKFGVSCSLGLAVKEPEEKPVGPPKKGGRPPKHDGKPWEAEGISRQAWYKRRKKAAEDALLAERKKGGE